MSVWDKSPDWDFLKDHLSGQVVGYHVDGEVHSVLFQNENFLRCLQFRVPRDGDAHPDPRGIHDVEAVREIVLIAKDA